MLSSELYSAVMEEERKGLSEASLQMAAKNVGATYNVKALKKGLAYLDYNKPQNRCAYLYKYAVVHTGLVKRFFGKLVRKRVVRDVLARKEDLKIICLGGGAGTDVVGIFKALSVHSDMHRRVSQASVLDLCVGWHETFSYILQHLMSGNVKGVPHTFVRDDFQAYFLEVNLLEPLSSETAEAIRDADIVCMVKFVSAVLGGKNSLKALKEIAHLFKMGAVILFIDNFHSNVSESVQKMSQKTGLKIVMGPQVESFRKVSKSNRSTFGCKPLRDVRVTVIGLMKTDWPIEATPNSQDSDDNWDTESEESNDKVVYCHRFTQTEGKEALNLEELDELVNALTDLMSVVTQLKSRENCCFNCDGCRL